MRTGKESKEEFLFGPWLRAYAPSRKNGNWAWNWESHKGSGSDIGVERWRKLIGTEMLRGVTEDRYQWGKMRLVMEIKQIWKRVPK